MLTDPALRRKALRYRSRQPLTKGRGRSCMRGNNQEITGNPPCSAASYFSGRAAALAPDGAGGERRRSPDGFAMAASHTVDRGCAKRTVTSGTGLPMVAWNSVSSWLFRRTQSANSSYSAPASVVAVP